jgi:hypothetical protein
MNLAAVALIVKCLTEGVMHPGDQSKDQPAKLLIPLPGFRASGLTPEQAAHFANEAGLPDNDAAKLYAEALVNAIETVGGLTLVAHTELEQLRTEAATLEDVNPSAPTVAVHCTCNRRTPIISISVGRAMVITNGTALRERLDQVCSC